MGFFKTKEEKQLLLTQKLNSLNEKYKSVINHFCMINTYVFIVKGFYIKDDKIMISGIQHDTAKGYSDGFEFRMFNYKWETDLIKAKQNWIVFRDRLDKLGVNLTLKNVTP